MPDEAQRTLIELLKAEALEASTGERLNVETFEFFLEQARCAGPSTQR